MDRNRRAQLEILETRRVLAGNSVLISEFMASNSQIADAFGETSDWIELHNDSDSSLDLTGWSLTDDPTISRKWTFLEGAIPSRERMLVWASGMDLVDPNGQYHTNFKLRAGGEFLGLTDPDGTIVSAFGSIDTEYPPQQTDVSYGIGEDQSIGYFRSVTPNEPNGPSFQGFVADTTFSVDRGFFDEPFPVEIASNTVGATLVYTLDGSNPTPTHGTNVEGGASPPRVVLDVDSTTTLRAMAFRDGWEPTNVDTQTYVFLDQVIRQTGEGLPNNWGHAGADYEMDQRVVNDARYSDEIIDGLRSLPSVSLVTDIDNWFGSRNGIYLRGQGDPRAVSMEMLFADETNDFQVDGSVEIQGGSSTNRWKSDKLSMQLKFKREFGDAKLKFPLFGDTATNEFDTLILDARLNQAWHYGGGASPTSQRTRAQYTRDQFMADLQNELGGRAFSGQWIHLYLNGIYWGMHNLHERPDEHFAAAYFGGDESDYDIVKHNSSVVSGSYQNYRELIDLVNGDTRSADVYASVASILDIDQLVDYVLLNYYAGNTDWAHHNWYASYNKVSADGKWRFHSWDAEHVLKALNDNATQREAERGPTHIHERLLRNVEYEIKFRDAVQRLFYNDGLFTPDAVSEVYQRRLDEVYLAVVPESARWGDNHRRQPYTRDVEWVRERDRLMEEYFPQRTEIALEHLRDANFFHRYDAPRFSLHGGDVEIGQTVTIRSGGEVYYTLDGSDPRNSQTRQIYTDGISITNNVTIRVRALHGSSDWSALVEAQFTTQLHGDLSDDGRLDASDLDRLHAAIRAGNADLAFDFTDDGEISGADADFWIVEIANTRRGDFNLDGKVGFDDFLVLAGTFGKSNARWEDGDADGDGTVGFQDFLLMATSFGFSNADER